MRFPYSFGDEAREREDGQCVSVGPEGVTEAGALWALKEQQPGDVPQTWADVTKAGELFGYKPTISFKDGVTAFYDWWKSRSSL